MAPPASRKRKRDNEQKTLKNKRPKNKSGFLFDDGHPDGQQWEARQILESDGEEYLVEWAGVDLSTGKQYEDTWVKKTSVGDELVSQWESAKPVKSSRAERARRGRPPLPPAPRKTRRAAPLPVAPAPIAPAPSAPSSTASPPSPPSLVPPPPPPPPQQETQESQQPTPSASGESSSPASHETLPASILETEPAEEAHSPSPQAFAPETPSSPLSTNMTTPTEDYIRAHFETEWQKHQKEAKARVSPPTKLKSVLSGPLLSGSSAGADTRSPSAIPDRSPPHPGPTSLRETAVVDSPGETAPTSPLATAPVLSTTPTLTPPPVLAPAPLLTSELSPSPPAIAPSSPIAVEESEAGRAASLLSDELHLLPEEYIVPLPMEGRQRSMYLQELRRKEDLLKQFLTEPQSFDQIREIQSILQKLKAVETHVDLIWAESSSVSQVIGPLTQHNWDIESCVKFRFLGSLLQSLRESEMHLLLVIKEEDSRLFDILVKFCQAERIQYSCPSKGLKAAASNVEGNLAVTILSSDSRPIVRPPTAIICLDGPLDSADIHGKMWAINPDRFVVPIIHLVIPRTIGHIERYVSPSLSIEQQLHTTLASLAQMHSEIGQPMANSPPAHEAAELVAAFLLTFDEVAAQTKPEWPLPSIGNVKDIIEYQSQQQSQETITSPVLGHTTSSKRPLDDDHMNSVKRMRMTPQPQDDGIADVTRSSESLPSTADEVVSLQAKLRRYKSALKGKDAQLKAKDKSLREWNSMCDRRENEHDKVRELLLTTRRELQSKTAQLEQADRRCQNIQERLDKKSAEVGELKARLQQERSVNLESEDEKTAEIARLRKELEEAKANEERAIQKAQSDEATLKYVNEERINLGDRFAELQKENEALTKELAIQIRKASGEVVELRKLALDQQYHQIRKQNDTLKLKSGNLERILQQKEEELSRIKSGKGVGMGTRAQSVPRSPRVGGPSSRGASPAPGVKDRLGHLRNG